MAFTPIVIGKQHSQQGVIHPIGMLQEAVRDVLGVLPGGGQQGEGKKAALVVVHGQAYIEALGLLIHLGPHLGFALEGPVQRIQPPVTPLADDRGEAALPGGADPAALVGGGV